MNKVKIYSTQDCLYCKSLKSYLDKKRVAYKEAMVDENHEALHEMLEESNGFAGVPFIVIKKGKDKKTKIKGFDMEKINETLKIK